MRILLLTFAYLPAIGGTEVYVAGLARELQDAGEQVQVVVASFGASSADIVEGVSVRQSTPADFRAVLEQWRPDVVHCHPLTGADLLPWMRVARQEGVAIVCTYHTATMTCGRGDLLLFGRDVCDGVIDVDRCSRCVLQERGLPAPLQEPLLWLSPSAEAVPSWFPRKVHSMFSIASQRSRGLAIWKEVRDHVDHWVAVSKAVAGVLAVNGVPRNEITVSRQGLVGTGSMQRPGQKHRQGTQSLVVGYLGRLHAHKGVDVLLEAVGRLPDARLEVRIAGGGEQAAEMNLRKRFSTDGRVRFLGPLAPHAVPAFLRGLDVLVVPSIAMETGPMTILEAWSAGTPVIGSDRGGIAEWFAEYGGGLAFRPGDAAALADLLRAVLGNEQPLPPPPESVRTMVDVGAEMRVLYSRIGQSTCTAG